MAEVIHKLNITAEAVFDLTECLGLTRFDKQTLKRETEEYITRQERTECIPWWDYFRCDYIDEDSGWRLKLFIYKRARLGLMQYWDLAGVCLAEEWTQEAEDDGLIRVWLQSKVEDIPDGEDEAVAVRVRKILRETEKTLFENILEEVESDFECERDKEVAKKMAFLQSVHFEFKRKRRTVKKDKRNRKSNSRP